MQGDLSFAHFVTAAVTTPGRRRQPPPPMVGRALLCMESSSQANLHGGVPGERTDMAKNQISAVPRPRISLTAAGGRRRYA
jgi:hypothetical protein